MSDSNSNGFGQDRFADAGADGNATGGRTWLWILGVLAAFGFLGLLACGGAIYLSWAKISEALGRQVIAEIGDHPTIQHHVGDVESAQMDWQAAMRDAEENPGKSRGIVVLKGSRGDATLAFEVGSGDRPASAELTLDDGTVLELDLEKDNWPAIKRELEGDAGGEEDAQEGSNAVNKVETDETAEAASG